MDFNEVVFSNLETPNDFAEYIIHLPVDMQNKFLEVLKEELSEEDWLTTVKFISLHGMYRSEAKYNAMKHAVKATLIEEIFGHTYEEPERKPFDPCNPVYMASINSMPFA
jgi:hypothetical protein